MCVCATTHLFTITFGDNVVGNIVRKQAYDSFFLIEPNLKQRRRSTEQMARSLALCRGVKKVFVTSGAYGFIVHARSNGKQPNKEISNGLLSRTGKARSKAVQCHFAYAIERQH